jgi:hypothetical protein
MFTFNEMRAETTSVCQRIASGSSTVTSHVTAFASGWLENVVTILNKVRILFSRLTSMNTELKRESLLQKLGHDQF